MTDICPACERGELAPASEDTLLNYDGAVLTVPGIEFSVCPVCGEEPVLNAQAKRNEVRYADAKRTHDGLRTSDGIATWRVRHQLTQRTASKMLGGGANAFYKYERGEVIQSKPMDLLMWLCDQFPQARNALADRAGIELDGNKWKVLEVFDERHEFTSLTKAKPTKKSTVGEIAAILCAPGHYSGHGENDYSYEETRKVAAYG